MTQGQKIMQFLESNPGEQRVENISTHTGVSQNTVRTLLYVFVRNGMVSVRELTREEFGKIGMLPKVYTFIRANF